MYIRIRFVHGTIKRIDRKIKYLYKENSVEDIINEYHEDFPFHGKYTTDENIKILKRNQKLVDKITNDESNSTIINEIKQKLY